MFSRIVVGVDGGPGGRDAMTLARRLATPGTRLTAVSVGVVDGAPTRGANLDYDRETREDAEARLATVMTQEPGVDGEALLSRSVATGLHAAVDRLGADLIVIGSCQRGPVGRILAGDDTRATLRDAPCPVAVAPREYELTSGPITAIGVGWDGRPESERALELAQAIASDHQGSVHALTVSAGPMWPPAAEGSAEVEIVTADVEPTAERIAALENVHATEATGVAAEELAQFAAEVDLLVVGSRRQGTLARIVLGSTSEHLTRHSVRPLLIVPRVPHPAATTA